MATRAFQCCLAARAVIYALAVGGVYFEGKYTSELIYRFAKGSRMNPQEAASNTRAPLEEQGSTMSPPHTWTESDGKTENEEDGDSRYLFSLVLSMPDGNILSSRIASDSVTQQELQPGANLFPLLDAKAQSFLVTAAATSHKQRLFCRINSSRMQNACELLCEFENQKAKVTALALRPAFGPSAPFHSITFTTKHTATCAISHMDYTSIPYLGHLPSDVLGRSILSLICAGDVQVVRQAHIDLFNSRGKVVKSVAPLRFVAYNGALLRAETEWSAYVNPWSKRIEMVVARHRIVDAPVGDANVLEPPAEKTQVQILPPSMAKIFEDELRGIMSTPVPHKRPKASMCQPAPRPADLGAYIDRIVETLVVSSTGALPVPIKVKEEPSSTDLPLTYNQINCLENVRRLLNSTSRPESPTVSDSPDERRPLPTVPLTRETLQQHTRRWEEECRETWSRRLKRMSTDMLPGHPLAKQARPSTSSTPPVHWSQAQREEFYRSLGPNPPPPPGKNFQITTVPLPPADTPTTTTATSERFSAFTAVQPKLSSLPLSLSIQQDSSPSVIHSPDALMVPMGAAASRLLFAPRALTQE